MVRPRRTLTTFVGLISTIVLITALSACGSNASTGSSATGAREMFAVFNPFSGGEAAFGPEKMAGCTAAVSLINGAGGILNHQFYCHGYDDRDDPVDAVPAANQMIASASHLVGVVGPTSDSGTATAPIINRAHVTFFSDSGEASLDRTNYTYFWRISPPDQDAGLAMALWAKRAGYKQIALVFGNDISEQGNVPAMVKGFQALGGKIAVNQRLNLDAPSYQSEVESLLAAHPQAIFTEMDPQSAATYFSELRQLHAPVPIVGTGNTLATQWLKSVSSALGVSAFRRAFIGVQPYVSSSGPAWAAYLSSLKTNRSKIKDVAQYYQDPYAQGVFDSVNLMALAMVAAKSTDPKVYNSFIPKVVNRSAGSTVVHTFKAGKRALLAGKTIDYVGAVGQVVFDRWHNSPGAFEVVRYVPSSGGNLDLPIVAVFTPAQMSTEAKSAGL